MDIGVNIKRDFITRLLCDEFNRSPYLSNIPLYIGIDLNIKSSKIDKSSKFINLVDPFLGDYLSVYVVSIEVDGRYVDSYYCFKDINSEGIEFIIRVPELNYESLVFTVSNYNINSYLGLFGYNEKDKMKPNEVIYLLNQIIYDRRKDMEKVSRSIKYELECQLDNLIKLSSRPEYFLPSQKPLKP